MATDNFDDTTIDGEKWESSDNPIKELRPKPKMKATIEFDLVDNIFTLHEHIANGTYFGEPVALHQTINHAQMFLNYKGKDYIIQVGDLIVGILQTVDPKAAKK